MTLAERLAEINAEAAAINAKGDGSWASGLVSDLDHWAKYNITTAEQLDHYLAACTFEEVYKSLNGVRPRWMNLNAMTTAEIEAETEKLCKNN